LKTINSMSPGLCRTFKDHLSILSPGIWMLDLFPGVEKVLRGPYKSVADAHRDRDMLWHYGEMHGRYVWVVTSGAAVKLCDKIPTFHSVELTTDNLTMEVVRLRVASGYTDWQIISNRGGRK